MSENDKCGRCEGTGQLSRWPSHKNPLYIPTVRCEDCKGTGKIQPLPSAAPRTAAGRPEEWPEEALKEMEAARHETITAHIRQWQSYALSLEARLEEAYTEKNSALAAKELFKAQLSALQARPTGGLREAMEGLKANHWGHSFGCNTYVNQGTGKCDCGWKAAIEKALAALQQPSPAEDGLCETCQDKKSVDTCAYCQKKVCAWCYNNVHVPCAKEVHDKIPRKGIEIEQPSPATQGDKVREALVWLVGCAYNYRHNGAAGGDAQTFDKALANATKVMNETSALTPSSQQTSGEGV